MIRLLGRTLVGIAAVIGALLASQFPEFAQQYRQRLGGALDEAQHIVSDFDASIAEAGLTRQQALDRYNQSDDILLRNQGTHTERSIDRYNQLLMQRTRLAEASPYGRPIIVLSYPDTRLIKGTWDDYEPSVPVTADGLVWGALGFFILGGAASLIRQLAGAAWSRRRWPMPRPEPT